MTQTITRMHVHSIAPERLAAMRTSGRDEQGNPFTGHPAEGWEPLRCCLRIADAGADIALIGFAPLLQASPWTEVGPVFVHAAECDGYAADAGLPDALRTGPRVLRSYRADGTLDYDHVSVVAEGEDIEPTLAELLAARGVAEVHVRALATQCFLFSVTR